MSPTHDPSQPPRRFRTAYGLVSTHECEMRDLRAGELFVGPDQRTVYRVVTPCSKHPRGWLIVRNRSMTDREAARLRATPGAVETGTDPRDGFFTYDPRTRLHRIV